MFAVNPGLVLIQAYVCSLWFRFAFSSYSCSCLPQSHDLRVFRALNTSVFKASENLKSLVVWVGQGSPRALLPKRDILTSTRLFLSCCSSMDPNFLWGRRSALGGSGFDEITKAQQLILKEKDVAITANVVVSNFSSWKFQLSIPISPLKTFLPFTCFLFSFIF